MCNYQWQNQPLTQIEIPERFKANILAYAQRLDASPLDDDQEIAQVQQAIYQQSITYGAKFQEHLLEQYKVYVEMADRISSRRLQTNGFFITIFSGLLAVITFIFNKDTQLSGTLQNVLLWGLSLLGIFLSLLWIQAINSSKILNSGKFKVINAIENILPCPGYYQEWNIVKGKGYQRATRIENFLARIFLGFWCIFVIYLITQIPAIFSLIKLMCQ
jgi:hypothetical protein